MKGKVKFFNEMKGFGFIKSDEDEKEYFVHITGIENQKELNEGDEVSFEVVEDQRGKKAINVSLVKSE